MVSPDINTYCATIATMRLRKLFTPLRRARFQSQPTPKVTADDASRIIRRDFPAESFAAVAAILSEYGSEKWQREQDRVLLAALKMSDGDLDMLRTQVRAAKLDYRDVLSAAEYPEYTKTGVFRVGKLPLKEQRRIIDSDWRQYHQWLRLML